MAQRIVMLLLLFLILSFSEVLATPDKIVISNFEPGIGESMPHSFWSPYFPALRSLVRYVQAVPDQGVILTAGVDKTRYSKSHDGSNGGLANDRLITLKEILLDMGLAEDRIIKETCFIKSDTGGVYRFVAVEVSLLPIYEGSDTTIYETRYVQQENYIFFNRYFGGMTLGISTAPDANFVFTLGGRLRLTDRIVMEGQVGHSLVTNSQTVELGRQVDAYGMYYGLYFTYRVEDCSNLYDTLVCSTTMLNVIIGVSQTENDTKGQFDYLLKRRVFEGGLTYRYHWLEVRGLMGYGFDETWRSNDVKYGWSTRLQVVAILFGH